METKKPNRDELLTQWIEAQKALEHAKVVELALRNQVVAVEFAEHKAEGTETHELGAGWKIKAVFKQNYTLDKEGVDDALTKLEETGPEGQFLAERLVKFEPKLQVSEYKKLPEFAKKIVDNVLTIKPGTPSLEIVAPKA